MKHAITSLLFSLVFCTTASADLILTPTAVVNNELGEWGPTNFGLIHAYNQSGLSSNYISGVTDISLYLAQNPTHLSNSDSTFFVSRAGTPFGNIDFDLGSAQTINSFVLWQATRFPLEQMTSFEIYTSNFANFSTNTQVGTFSASIFPQFAQSTAQLFSLTSSNARYVRLRVLGNSGSGSFTDLGEIAFGVSAAVPEPSTVALLLTGCIGLVGYGWRRKAKHSA